MLTLGQGLGQKMAATKVKLEQLTNKYLPTAIDATNDSYGAYADVNSLIHILHNMF